MNALRTIPLMIPLLAFGAGCSETIDSKDIGTDGIYADIEVTARGDGSSEVEATLLAGGDDSNVYVELTPNDSLIAYGGSQPAVMSGAGGAMDGYHASFATDAADTSFKVSFLRSHAEGAECNGISAPNSVVTLPAPLAVTGPAENAVASRTAALTLTWSGYGQTDPLTWSVDGSCIAYTSGSASDTGTLTLPAGSIDAYEDHETEACTITVTLVRTRGGSVDPAFGEGGVMTARQVRSRTLVSVP